MDFTTLEFHLVHFSCPSCPVKVHPVHSNTCIFSHLFLCISLLASSFTVPCITVFAKPDDLEMWPNKHSFCILAIDRSSLYSPISAWIFLRTLSGPSCSKLTTSLVNVWLNFQKLISQICQYFCCKNVRSFCSAKASLIFSTKNISVLSNKVVKHLAS